MQLGQRSHQLLGCECVRQLRILGEGVETYAIARSQRSMSHLPLAIGWMPAGVIAYESRPPLARLAVAVQQMGEATIRGASS